MIAVMTALVFLKLLSASTEAALIANARSTSGIDGRYRSVGKMASNVSSVPCWRVGVWIKQEWYGNKINQFCLLYRTL